MQQAPEIELLLLCARPQLDDSALSRIPLLLEGELDWQLIFRWAEYYRTTPLLAFHLHQHATHLLSTDIQTELQAHHRNSTRHNLALAVEMFRLMDLFSTERVSAIPFKGAVSAELAYGDMAMRACGDIDLLVRPDEHDKVERLLENEGYYVEIRYPNAMQSSLWHEQRRVNIDLHWGIPPETLRLASERLWDELEPVHLLGRSVLTLSPCDTLLVTATNAVKEYWRPSLHHLSDIATLTRHYSNSDWLEAFHRARKIGCQRMLVAALLFAHRLLAMNLPPVGPTRLFHHQGINRIVDELQDHLFLPPDEQSGEAAMKLRHHQGIQRYYLTLTDSPLRRISAWLKWAFIPNSADQAVVKLPKTLSFLYFIIRPIRLLRKRL